MGRVIRRNAVVPTVQFTKGMVVELDANCLTYLHWKRKQQRRGTALCWWRLPRWTLAVGCNGEWRAAAILIHVNVEVVPSTILQEKGKKGKKGKRRGQQPKNECNTFFYVCMNVFI